MFLEIECVVWHGMAWHDMVSIGDILIAWRAWCRFRSISTMSH